MVLVQEQSLSKYVDVNTIGYGAVVELDVSAEVVTSELESEVELDWDLEVEEDEPADVARQCGQQLGLLRSQGF